MRIRAERRLIALALAWATRLAGAQATPASWVQLRNGTDNAGVVTASLEVAWQYRAPRPVRGLAVAQGVVVMGTESADADAAPQKFADDQRGFVVALDAATGRQLWTRPVASWIHGDPIVRGGAVYVSYGRWPMTYPGGIAAFDLRTGKSRWSLDAESGLMPGPALDTTSGQLLVAGGDGVLYTLAPDDGAVRRALGLRSAAAMSSPRIDGGVAYFGAMETLASFATSDGHTLWRFRAPGMRAVGDVPVALADTVVYTTATRLYGFWNAARTLRVSQFASMTRDAWRTHPWRSYHNWYQQQWLMAVDRRDGHLLWQRPLGVGLEVPRNTSGTPVLAAGLVIVSSPVSRTVWAFDAGSGRALWQRALSSVHKGAVTVVGTDVVLGDKSGHLTAIDLRNGQVLGRCEAGAAFTPFAPVMVGRTMFVATRDGWVHARPWNSLRQRMVQHGSRRCF